MSHFTVLVIGPNPEKQLAPFHEFECTGTDDEFVLDLDKTEEYRVEWQTETKSCLLDPSGTIHDRYGPQFFRDPTPEELEEIGSPTGTGGNGKYSWNSKDWGDGRGYRTKIHFIPEGFMEVERPYCEVMTFARFVEEWHGVPFAPVKEPRDLADKHKYGYAVLLPNGEIDRVIRRTNPRAGVYLWVDDKYTYGTGVGDKIPPGLNFDPTTQTFTDHHGAPVIGTVRKEQVAGAKWDWYVIGGRWSGFFTLKPTSLGTTLKSNWANKGDIDFRRMRTEAGINAYVKWDKAHALTNGETWETWGKVLERFPDDIEAAREHYHTQPPVKALRDAGYWEYDTFTQDREAYAENARQAAGVAFAVIKDGVWYERGQMGWFGCVSDEKDKGEWHMQYCALLSDLPDDTLLSIYDCHI